MEVETPFEVLWADADPSDRIYYAAALRYVAEAEEALFRKAGFASSETLRQGYGFPRAHVELDYRRPLKIGDRGATRAWIGRVGNSSIRMNFCLAKQEEAEPYIEGHIDMVMINLKSGYPITVPEEMRNVLTAT